MIHRVFGHHFPGELEGLLAIADGIVRSCSQKKGEIVFGIRRVGLAGEDLAIDFDGVGIVAAGLIGEGEVEIEAAFLGGEGDRFLEIGNGPVVLLDLEMGFAESIE